MIRCCLLEGRGIITTTSYRIIIVVSRSRQLMNLSLVVWRVTSMSTWSPFIRQPRAVVTAASSDDDDSVRRRRPPPAPHLSLQPAFQVQTPRALFLQRVDRRLFLPHLHRWAAGQLITRRHSQQVEANYRRRRKTVKQDITRFTPPRRLSCDIFIHHNGRKTTRQ